MKRLSPLAAALMIWVLAVMFAIVAAYMAGLAFSANALPVPQDPPCEARPALIAHLATSYGEHARHGGVLGNGASFDIFVSQHGTWSAVVHFPTGRSCVMAVGTDWDERGKPI